MIRDLLNAWEKVNLFTRLRRFGKSLNMSMLKAFFEIDSRKELFNGLAIAQEKGFAKNTWGSFLSYRSA